MDESARRVIVDKVMAQPTPADVLSDFRMLCEVGAAGGLIFKAVIPPGGVAPVYCICVETVDGSLNPVAMIPVGINVIEFARRYDQLMQRSGIAVCDPDFRGSIQ